MDDPKAQLVDRLRVLLDVVDGRKLPSEPALASALGASRPAVREALTRLESEGLVSRRQGAETTINREARRLQARFDQQVEFVDVITASGRTASVDVLESGHTVMSTETSELLHLPAGTTAFRTVKRWSADGQGVMVAVDEFAWDPATDPRPDPDASLFDNAAAVRGQMIQWEIARPTAIVADDQLAAWMGTDGPLLMLDLLGVARTGELLYRAREYHVPGAVEFGFIRTFTAP
jgi:GntR family transcriptional regulator